jgi:hypothetical protein
MNSKQVMFAGPRVSKSVSIPIAMIESVEEYRIERRSSFSSATQELIMYGLIYAKQFEEPRNPLELLGQGEKERGRDRKVEDAQHSI